MEKPSDNPQDVLAVRRAKLAMLRDQGLNPYPGTVSRTHTLAELRDGFTKLEKSGDSVTIVGRVMTFRTHGKISFATIRDGSGEFQLAFQADVLGDRYDQLEEEIDLGDFVEASGTVFTTKRGEQSLSTTAIRIISKSLRPLPEKWHGLKDPEERFRRRYLDMIANPEVRDKLVARAKMVRAIRNFLDERGFVEIENPVLETVASGGAAQPFQTHINAFDLDVYLRVAIGELWQKRSLIGGFEKTYEIGRAFRNEGVDYSHNPDFTMLEYYWAYADYEDNMKLHEELIPAAVKAAISTLKVDYEGETIDFTAPYPRITFRDAIKEASGVDIDPFIKAGDEIDGKGLAKEVKAKTGTDYSHLTPNKLLDDLFKDTWRAKQVQPVFVTHYPIILKPLTKRSADDGRYGDIFQLVAAGMELSNSYSELNDPEDQKRRFEEQAALAKAGDDEAMAIDTEYVEALEYGMPPATGTGIGIDRLAALLTNSHSIREVTAYPLMKPRGGSDD